jgi:hypothetical protein
MREIRADACSISRRSTDLAARLLDLEEEYRSRGARAVRRVTQRFPRRACSISRRSTDLAALGRSVA